MKRGVIILLLICFLLTGCTRPAEYREPEQVIITSALGFDNVNGKLFLCAETVKTDKESGGYTPWLVTGLGDSVSLVLQDVSDSLGGELFLGHCATVILGSTLTQAQLGDIFSFLQSNENISLAVKLTCADNARRALSSKTYSSEAVGYDILKLMTTKSDTADNKNYASLYSIAGYKVGQNPCFTLPFFSIADKEGEEYLYPSGAVIYVDDILIYRLSPQEEILFKILSNNYSSGIVRVGAEKIDIQKSQCDVDISYSNKSLKISFNIAVTADSDTQDEDNLERAMENESLNFLHSVQTQIKEDIFYITEKIKRHYPIIYKRIESNPLEAFLNSEILVQCNIKKGEE